MPFSRLHDFPRVASGVEHVVVDEVEVEEAEAEVHLMLLRAPLLLQKLQLLLHQSVTEAAVVELSNPTMRASRLCMTGRPT